MRRFYFLGPPLLCLFLIVIGSFAEHPDKVGLGEDAKKILEDIGQVGKYALALWIGSAAIKEVIAKALEESGRDLKDTIGLKLGDTGDKVTAGFGNLTAVVETALIRMKVHVQLMRDEPTLKQSDEEVAKAVSPEAAALAREGKAHEAIAKIELDTKDPRKKAQQEIAVLILSDKESDWELAAKRLENGEAASTDSFHRLSFKFWSANKVNEAIKLAEEGLALAGKSPHSETVALELKNNLAYFYADANKTDKKNEAFQYIREARQQWPLNAEILETEACVKIAFGSKEEAIAGLAQCMDVAAAKDDLTTFKHWLQRYNQRTF